MAYIHQQQHTAETNGPGNSNANNVMSGSYEVHLGGEQALDGKLHIVDGSSISNRSDSTEESGINTNTNNSQQLGTRQSHLSSQPSSAQDDISEEKSQDDSESANKSASESGGKSNCYKYPQLRQYFEFGPWVGRNRKAQCLSCRQQTSSSQPDRLLKHLNRCASLSAEDKALVVELMNERTAIKRKRPTRREGNSSLYDDGDSLVDDLNRANTSGVSIPPTPKRSRRDNSDKNSDIDEALTRFIVMCRIPLKAIHSREFIALCRALNPDYQIPSRETITNVLIPGLLNII